MTTKKPESKIRREIRLRSAKSDKPVLRWLFDRYHFESQWGFVAACRFKRYGTQSYEVHRVWMPTAEGRALYNYAHGIPNCDHG